jgi:hypothetical protein
MSRHHMLPPIIYTPPPKPKKIENRKSRIQLRSAGQIRNAADVEETDESSELGSPAPLTNKAPLQAQMPIEGSERKPPSTYGYLSEGTVTALLMTQEVAK